MNYDICVFGGCSIDAFYYAGDDGKYKDKPDTLVPGGKGSNQAVAAARAGANVTIITKLGKDNIGQNILDNLIYNGVHTNNVELIPALVNDYAEIYINSSDKDNTIVRKNGAVKSFTPDMVNKYKNVLLHSKMVLAQMKVPKEVSVELINFCYSHKIPIIITPCRPEKLSIGDPGNARLIDKISIITCNKKECQTIFGKEDVEECVKMYPNKLIVTLGDDGLIYSNGERVIQLPPPRGDKVEDTTGAGDTFTGNLAALLVKGEKLEDAIYKAQFASAMKIRIRSAQEGMPYKDELDSYINNYLCKNKDCTEEFNVAYKAIKDAAKEILRFKAFTIRDRSDSKFSTDSDFISERIIMNKIKEEFPNDVWITEGLHPDNQIQGRTWVVDPIDGTAHYMKNSIFWGIQLAFIENGETQFAMIYIPKLDEFYYAIKDRGAYLNHVRITASNFTFNQSIIEFCGSMYKKIENKQKLFNKLAFREIKPANFMYLNASSFAFANILSNRTNVMVLSTDRLWDILPGTFITNEAGINRYSYDDLVIFSNSKEFDEIIKE